MEAEHFFKNKKITLLGLGLLGRGLGDAKFLAEAGAKLTITDLKKSDELASSRSELKKFNNIRYVLGEHRLEDFRDCDMVIKAAGVPIDSPFIAEAKKNGIPVEMDASLFAKLAPDVILIGVTGTRGKTTTTLLIFEILSKFFTGKSQKVFLAGNVQGKATLPLLREVRARDIVVLELDSWQLAGFGEAKISPHIAVFTNLMNDHLNYYGGSLEEYFEDKAQIFLHQRQNDYLVTGEKVAHLITAKYLPSEPLQRDSVSREGLGQGYGKLFHPPISVSPDTVPKDWKIKILGRHNLENIALALRVGKIMNIPYDVMQSAVENFKGVPGRLEFVREIGGVKIYNDTTATTPDATVAGLAALSEISKGRNTILIFGGADKKLDMSQLFKAIPLYCKAAILLISEGKTSGSERVKAEFEKMEILKDTAGDLGEALKKATALSERGDVILLSPAFASFGMFKNEYDRGEQFNEEIKKLV